MSRRFIGPLIVVALWMPLFAGGQSATAHPPVSVHSEADLVLVDVVVTDAGRNPVHGLNAADFTLLESGHEQTIKTFEEHKVTQSASLPPLPKLSPGVFTNYSPTPASGALNILLLDTLNTPMADQSFVHDQLLKYLKEARPGTRMAIFGLNSQLRLLQGFTSNPELLRAVLNGNRGLPKGSPLMDNAVAGDAPGADDPMMDSATEALGNSPDAAAVVANLKQFEAEQQSYQLQARARFSLDAFNQLGRYLSGLPGRKNLIWFSGSFPINILPDGDLMDPFSIVASAEDEFRETTDLLALSHVAVYPIDARGLMISPVYSVANSSSSLTRSPNAYGKADAKFTAQTANEHATMQRIAEATGGESFVNTNGLAQAVDNAVEAGSNYTRLATRPPIANGRASTAKSR
jgi:VWFA-related protein